MQKSHPNFIFTSWQNVYITICCLLKNQYTRSKCKEVPAHETKTFGAVKVKVPSSLILVLDGRNWSASRPGPLKQDFFCTLYRRLNGLKRRSGRFGHEKEINYPNWNQTTIPRLSRQQPNITLSALFLLLVDRWSK